MHPQILPISTIQHDFLAVGADVRNPTSGIASEDVWVSVYKHGQPSVHGKVNASASASPEGVEWTAREGVEFNEDAYHEPTMYTIGCPSLDVRACPVVVPKRIFRMAETSGGGTHAPLPITSLAVAPDVSQFASGHTDGSIFLQSLSTSSSDPNNIPPPVRTKPHLSSLTALRFFPSSRVLLSASLDFTLHILPADPASYASSSTTRITPARTLKAHTRAITDTAIVALGRNVLSSSKDGTVRLWDVSSGEAISTLAAHRFSAVNRIALGANTVATNGAVVGAVVADAREADTHDKVVFCALLEGSVEVFDLRTKSSVLRVAPPVFSPSTPGSAPLPISSAGGLTALAFDEPRSLLATGSASGLVCVYDVRHLPPVSESPTGGGPLAAWVRNGASIEDMCFTTSPSALSIPPTQSSTSYPMLAISAADGLTYIACLDAAPGGTGDGLDVHVSVAGEVIAGDCETIRAMRGDAQGGVWGAGDEGIVRLY